jgi:hypothetical protein
VQPSSAAQTVARPPFLAGLLIGGWLSLLIGAGANAGWLFMALKRAGVQFASRDTRMLDAEETGRVLAGVLAQPAFLAVFMLGMVVGPAGAWLLLRRARTGGPGARRLRWAAAGLVVAGAIGGAQLALARTIADHAVERTEALVSDDQPRAAAARSALDAAHRASEAAYAAQTLLVAAAALILVPRPRP